MSGIVAGNKFYERIRRTCRKCGHEVYETDTPGYRYQCLNCYEDLYEFETDEKPSDIRSEVKTE